MTHLSENSERLTIRSLCIYSLNDLLKETQGFTDVCVLRLPPFRAGEQEGELQNLDKLLPGIIENLGPKATFITLGEVIDLVQVQANMPNLARYQHWIAVKRATPIQVGNHSLTHAHFGALIHTKYKSSLQHAKTRIEYTYCPACDKTTKDYGGKKHTYHELGTLLSDVWRDIEGDLDGDISSILSRFADMFGIFPYKELLVLDCRSMGLKRSPANKNDYVKAQKNELPENLVNQVLHGDCLERLKEIPDNSIDFAFTDPPYNLGKQYQGYSDDLEIAEYFNWCDQWISEMARTLRPGRTCAILNIPLWAVRHFLFMKSILKFQNWIAWDALAFPVRLIMPSHYTILCFSKGEPRELPGLIGEAGVTEPITVPKTFKSLEPLAEGYCLRSRCVAIRQAKQINDCAPLADIWSDIHRLKHNTRRVDHPCQLPPHLMYRLISIFTKPGEIVLDCFNGAGTTTLTAHQLGRRYLGIESSEAYWNMANERHREIEAGLDPFRREERILTAKNSPVPRLAKQKYVVSKKTLQLEVKRVANELGKLPTREELEKYGTYPIKYYDEYFVSWGEVCAAARTTGMTEDRPLANGKG